MIGKTATRSATGIRTGRRIVEPLPRKKLRYYVCRRSNMSKRAKFGQNPCFARNYPASLFDEPVIEFLQKIATNAAVLDSVLAQETSRPKPNDDEESIKALEAKIAEIETRERKLIETSLSLGNIEINILGKMLNETGAEKSHCQDELERLRANRRRDISPRRSDQIRQALENVSELLNDKEALNPLSPSLQKLHSFLRLNFERIEFEEPEPFQIANLKVTLKI